MDRRQYLSQETAIDSLFGESSLSYRSGGATNELLERRWDACLAVVDNFVIL